MQRLATPVLAFLCSALVGMSSALAAPLTVSATSIAVTVGQQAQLQVAGGSGHISVAVSSLDIAKASLASGKITVTGVKAGKTEMKVRDRNTELKVSILVSGTATPPPPPPGAGSASRWTVLASNDLGMHCADLDYQIFSILPPFNVVHAQVVLPGTATAKPRLLSGAEADVFYRAASTPGGSVNTTSQSSSLGPKTNFWNPAALPDGTTITLGGMGYRSLYPGVDKIALPCPIGGPCASVLDLFALPGDKGLPVPDPAKLPELAAGQQWMPGPSNVPQKFGRYDADLPFFAGFAFGTTVKGANWFSADGIPILPVDDAGATNPYPLMRIQAVAKGVLTPTAANAKGSVDIVLPVASEADCRLCHNGLSGVAAVFAKTTTYANGTTWPIMQDDFAPGPDKANNAAKINILRLHDAKHGPLYTSSAAGALPTPCTSGSEPSCLDKRRAIQCSQCHYSPALDLAQVGPIDETSQGASGRQQRRHVSMSRAMHYNHGQYTDLFPAMPLPKTAGRTLQSQADILDQTCYTCHPGKQTKCLRGAMGAGGVVCQDCHGDMKQVGNDFTANFPTTPGVGAAGKRVPWAMEPKCQSCHVGDAKTVTTMNRTDQIVAPDGIRLLLAYAKSAAGSPVLTPNESPTSRFAEDQKLYRLSKGHGGVACNGCHGATHAEWPNPNPLANDNIAATQLQGHSGTLIECNTCHAAGSLGLTLNGPHGMHPVNDARWTSSHSDFAEKNLDSCRTCHGLRGQGTVLARVAATRTLRASEEGTRTVTLQKGTQVRCDTCHENKL